MVSANGRIMLQSYAEQIEAADPYLCFECKIPLTDDEFIVGWKCCIKCLPFGTSKEIWADMVQLARMKNKEE